MMTQYSPFQTVNEFDLKAQGLISRLSNQTFQFDPHMKAAQFSAQYFIKTAYILNDHFKNQVAPTILMQFFQRQNALLCGIDEAISLIHVYAKNPQDLTICALNDGDFITPFEPVLTIEGTYAQFGFLEGMIDGILARRSSIATQVHHMIAALKAHHSQSQIIFMGDRDDFFQNQMGDGYASKIGGINQHATDAMGLWFGGQGTGTMPHALIQGFQGDVVAAAHAYLKSFPDDRLIPLVDYHNDVIAESLKLASTFGSQLYGVRVDTSPMMVDQYFIKHPEILGQFDPRGVNPHLIKALRAALDQAGFQTVKIVASGGFNLAKLNLFLEHNTPVDIYGVGASLLQVNIGFTGDCVLYNQSPCAKSGRRYLPNPRLQTVLFQP